MISQVIFIQKKNALKKDVDGDNNKLPLKNKLELSHIKKESRSLYCTLITKCTHTYEKIKENTEFTKKNNKKCLQINGVKVSHYM